MFLIYKEKRLGMKSFEQFVKENIEQKPKHKTILEFEEPVSDGKELDSVVDVDDNEEEK